MSMDNLMVPKPGISPLEMKKMVAKCRSILSKAKTFSEKAQEVYVDENRFKDRLHKVNVTFERLDEYMDELYDMEKMEVDFDEDDFDSKRDEYEAMYYEVKRFLEVRLDAMLQLKNQTTNANGNGISNARDEVLHRENESARGSLESILQNNLLTSEVNLENNPGHVTNENLNSNSDIIKILLDQQSRLMETLVNQRSSSGRSEAKSVKLPLLEIPKFHGDLKDWIAFRDLFLKSVDGNNGLSDSQKLQYLKTLVQGEAAKTISHFSISDYQYKPAWDSLIEAFDRPKFLLKTFLSQFFETKKISNEAHVWTFTITIFQILNAIENLGTYSKSIDPWIIYIITDKLDPETQKLWNNESAGLNEPTVNDMKRFLRQRSDSIEYGKKDIGKSCRICAPSSPETYNKTERDGVSSVNSAIPKTTTI